MKKFLLSLSLSLLVATAFGQGTVDFANSSKTLVWNDLRGGPANTADGLLVALYWAPLSDPNNFTQLGAAAPVAPSTFPVAGRFIGGTRETGSATAPGEGAWFLVRMWEAAYGSSYEAALATPALNGRNALTSVSPIFRLATGGSGIPPSTPTSVLGTTANPGFQGLCIFTTPCPEPNVALLGIIAGAAALSLTRRAKSISRRSANAP